MTAYRADRELPHPCAALFALIADVESYPTFLPLWRGARILRRNGDRLWVEQRIGAGPLRLRFHSRALLHPPEALRIEVADGPLRGSVIRWSLQPSDTGCRVSLEVVPVPFGGPLSRLVDRFAPSPEAILSAFARRAAKRLGS